MAEVTRQDGTSVTSLAEFSTHLLNQQLIHQLWITLTFGSFHYLADKESNHGLLPGAVLLKLLGIRGNNVVNNLLQRGSVRRLLRSPFFLIDLREIFPALEAQIVKILEHLAGDRTAVHQ